MTKQEVTQIQKSYAEELTSKQISIIHRYKNIFETNNVKYKLVFA